MFINRHFPFIHLKPKPYSNINNLTVQTKSYIRNSEIMTNVTLSWTNPTKLSDGSTPPVDNIITNVVVNENTTGSDVVVATLPGSPTTYQILNVSPGTHTYDVEVKDSNDLVSEDSNQVTVVVPTPVFAFSSPTNLTAVLN